MIIRMFNLGGCMPDPIGERKDVSIPSAVPAEAPIAGENLSGVMIGRNFTIEDGTKIKKPGQVYTHNLQLQNTITTFLEKKGLEGRISELSSKTDSINNFVNENPIKSGPPPVDDEKTEEKRNPNSVKTTDRTKVDPSQKMEKTLRSSLPKTKRAALLNRILIIQKRITDAEKMTSFMERAFNSVKNLHVIFENKGINVSQEELLLFVIQNALLQCAIGQSNFENFTEKDFENIILNALDHMVITKNITQEELADIREELKVAFISSFKTDSKIKVSQPEQEESLAKNHLKTTPTYDPKTEKLSLEIDSDDEDIKEAVDALWTQIDIKSLILAFHNKKLEEDEKQSEKNIKDLNDRAGIVRSEIAKQGKEKESIVSDIKLGDWAKRTDQENKKLGDRTPFEPG